MSSSTADAPAGELIRWGLTEFDPWDPRITNDNIWELYRAMRDEGPVVRSDAHEGFFCITRYAEVRAAASDFRTFSSAQGVMIGRRKDTPALPLEYDRPEHTPYRKAIQRPFLANRIGAFNDGVRREVRALLDEVVRAGTFDIVRDIAAPLPLRIISACWVSRGVSVRICTNS